MILFVVLCALFTVTCKSASSTNKGYKEIQANEDESGVSSLGLTVQDELSWKEIRYHMITGIEHRGRDTVARSRSKRALLPYGVFLAARVSKVVRGLLGRATRVESGRRLFSRQFEMKGNYQQAKTDFESLRLPDVKQYDLPDGVIRQEGNAGDMTVVFGNKDGHGKPYIKIYYDLQSKQARYDKIVYID